ncbi:TIGR03016 family PEP-CTERM system-associated outer membrane protein [Thalassotalea aquiviva]|uniref:TIGR03016 family PEP-CTERM system-associated outer membrane protein n=1 Tax=Thalassotalea aquiviva TaxID=3242415 RepID=UPI003529F1B6
MARKKLKFGALLYLLYITYNHASEINTTQKLSLKETYSDNITLSKFDKKSSLVTLVSPGFSSQLNTSKVSLDLNYTLTRAYYSHNHNIDSGYNEGNIDFTYFTPVDGLSVTLKTGINNVSKNNARNSLADIVTGDTTETRSVEAGLAYNLNFPSWTFNSETILSKNSSADGIGEREGYKIKLNSSNGVSARDIFWNMDSNYSDYENRNLNGTNYRFELTTGLITNLKINPFLRFYDEKLEGNLNRRRIPEYSSIGVGIRWLANDHLYLDLAYNWVNNVNDSISTQSEDRQNENNISGNLSWQPSKRTQLKGGFSNRFYGDSYDFNFSHTFKRLSTNINYSESITAFDRLELEESMAEVWCLSETQTDFSDCIIDPQIDIDLSDYTLIDSITVLNPIESESFSLVKALSINIGYHFRRSKVEVNASRNKRQNLSVNNNDYYDRASVSFYRDLTPRSSLSVNASFNRNDFNQNQIDNTQRESLYRFYSLNYSKNLTPSLNLNVQTSHLNRSSGGRYNAYKENRLSLLVNKEF